MEFWEKAFLDKQLMWGEAPASAARDTAHLFKENGFQNVLIPGFGYGRNAKPFFDAGFKVTGIEISKTAISLSREFLGFHANIFEGSVDKNPSSTSKKPALVDSVLFLQAGCLVFRFEVSQSFLIVETIKLALPNLTGWVIIAVCLQSSMKTAFW